MYLFLECSFFCVGTVLQTLSPSPIILTLSFYLQRPKRKQAWTVVEQVGGDHVP